MKFLTKMAVLPAFAIGVTSLHAADYADGRARGSISGAIVSANTGRMVAMPIAPGINTTTNMVSNAPTVSVGVGTNPSTPPVTIDYCGRTYFNLERCCTQANAPAYLCNPVDYCRAPNFDYAKCCAGSNPPAEICDRQPPVIDYCREPNFDREKCCASDKPDPRICAAVDFCAQPYFDLDKCCAGPNAPAELCAVDECGDVIPSLGVDKCVAERACASIQANGYSGIFELETLQCLIPVVAHNWGGVIRANGNPVYAYIPMGNMFKCEAKSFESVRALRRTSQWVVPVMVVGGAGIGAGVGALIDNYDNNKAEKFKEEAAANAYPTDGRSGAEMGDKPYFVSPGATTTKTVQLVAGGPVYNLDNPADRATVIRALGVEPGTADPATTPTGMEIQRARDDMDACVADLFRELVSPMYGGQYKFGRVKVTDRIDGCDNRQTGSPLYCQSDRGTNSALAPCPGSLTTVTGEGIGFPSAGRCYFRDGFGPVSQFEQADSTASDDLYRATILKNLMDSDYGTMPNIQALHDAGCFITHDGVDNETVVQTYTASRGRDALNYLVVRCSTNFGAIPLKSVGVCDRPALGNTRDNLWAAYGAANALKDYVPNNDSVSGVPNIDEAKLDKLLADIQTTGTNIITTTPEFDQRVDELFGTKRPFFQTATGRGLLVGTGVGVLGGLGYWFAEGASVFCNVGGLDQTKLGRYFSIPSFREYIVRYGWIK